MMSDRPNQPTTNPELMGLDALDRVIEQYWPLVLSVCRAQLADHHEAEDAAQETFLKLMRHRDNITGNVAAWLTATARTTAIDHVRKAIRQRQRRERWVDSPARAAADSRHALAEHAVLGLLPEALLELDASTAQLLTDRFIKDKPLRVLAGQRQVSVPTTSRWVAQAINQLTEILSDMGVLGAAQMPLTAYLASLGEASPDADAWACDYYRDQGLRHATHLPHAATQNFPGWDRPLRLGLSLSYYNHSHFTPLGYNSSMVFQARRSQWIDHPAIQLVGIVEPKTSHIGPIESTLRDYELNAGLVDITDTQALATLDVILMPNRLFHTPQFIRPVLMAVRSGVGLLQEGFCGIRNSIISPEDEIYEYMMARPPIGVYCSGNTYGSFVGHNLPVPATVLNPHPALPWLGRGQEITALSCCAIFQPADHATVIAARDEPLQICDNPQLPSLRPPVVITGYIGRGRAININMVEGDPLFGKPPVCYERILTTLAWLGEPQHAAEAPV